MKNIVKIQAARKDGEERSVVTSAMSITALQSDGDTPICIPSPPQPISEDDRMPPINMRLLKEMSVEVLSNNLQVRHDLVLDEDCRVQNKNKLMSQQMRERSGKYWRFVDMELSMLLDPYSRPYVDLKSTRLYTVLSQIREMILEIYPNSEKVHEHIDEAFDLDFIITCIRNGNFDAMAWISVWVDVIKSNCAPRRDPYVDSLVLYASENRFVDLLRAFLELNNLMHLDIVNFTLGNMRSQFEATLVSEEQAHFVKEFGSFRMWTNIVKRLIRQVLSNDVQTPGEVYLEMFLHLMFDSKFPIPETFTMDHWRIETFRNDLSNIALISSMYLLLKQLCPFKLNEETVARWKNEVQLILCESQTSNRLGDFMITFVNRCRLERDQPSLPGETISTFVSKMASEDGPVREKLFSSLNQLMRLRLTNGKMQDREWCRSKGLELAMQQCEKLTLKTHRLFIHNWQVFGKLYTELIRQQKST